MALGLAAVAAGGGIIAGLWGNIRMWFTKITGLLIVRVNLNESWLVDMAMRRLLISEFHCSPLGLKTIRGGTMHVRPEKKNLVVAMEGVPSEPTIWWRGRRAILVNGSSMQVSFLRWTWNYKTLVKEAVDKYNEFNDSNKGWRSGMDRFYVKTMSGSIGQRQSSGADGDKGQDSTPVAEASDDDKYVNIPIGWCRDELGQPRPDSPMDKLWLTPQALEAVEEATRWRDSEEWFKSHNVPWKRGNLLHGIPGTGKTAFVRALGQDLNMPIFSFDLATMSNQDFQSSWERVKGNVPCIALFEDFDAVFDGRTNVTSTGKMQNGVSFDCILNQMDGVENTDGVYTIVTTNALEKIDPAIGAISVDGDSSRPGRIDKSIEFIELPIEGREKIADRILGGFEKSDWNHLIEDTKDLTGAQFQYRCSRLAMELFWKDKS